MRILLVEDEAELGRMLVTTLSRHGIIVDCARTLAIAREAIAGAVHDAVVLDRTLPDGDGLSLLAAIKAGPQPIPVIILSALGTLDHRVEGLDTGADDYLAKPFALDELLARLRAITRRPVAVAQQRVTIGRLGFEVEHHAADVDGIPLELPRRELLVLEALICRAGRVVTRDALEKAVYGYDDEIASNTLDAHISRLRRKLAAVGLEIHTMRGIGYLLRCAE